MRARAAWMLDKVTDPKSGSPELVYFDHIESWAQRLPQEEKLCRNADPSAPLRFAQDDIDEGGAPNCIPTRPDDALK
jgi:hypothetical protein